jgi:hypothetical protein
MQIASFHSQYTMKYTCLTAQDTFYLFNDKINQTVLGIFEIIFIFKDEIYQKK